MKLFTLFIVLLLIGCKHAKHVTAPTVKEPIAVPKNYGADLQGKWQLENLWGMDSTQLRPAYISFDFDSLSFTGNTGCNSISGKFSFSNELIIIDRRIISTKMACPGYNDKNFINLLLKINRFNIENNTLELSQNDLVLMTFRKE
jgi:heat shock protein HslJ